LKVLVSDPISDEGISILKQVAEVDVITNLSPAELVEKISEYDALVVRSETQVTKEVLEAGHLKIVGRAGVGVDNIDIDAATRCGTIVVNAPFGNMNSAAEHTIAMMMAMTRNIPQAYASMKKGEWNRKQFMGCEVKGKTLGVIGLGRIGIEVVKRAQGLEMKTIGYDPFISEERAKDFNVVLKTVNEIVQEADFITVHTPLTKDTRNIIDKAQFAIMKKGARIINCARGGIINEDALYNAAKNGIVSAAAIDVFVNEPPTGSPLLELDNIITTPHLGASTEEAQINVAVDVANEIVHALKGENVSTALNMPSIRSDVMNAIAPYMQLAETIGHLASQLMVGSYDTVKVEYCGELAEKDVKPITVAVIKGLLDTIMGSAVNYVNAQMLAKERKIEVIESKSSSSSCYQNSLSLTLIKGAVTKTVAGSIIGGEMRIIKIDSYQVDIKPTGIMIISRHLNKPNIIGPCCLALGKQNINIAGMQVSPSGIGDEAIMAINVDSDIPEDVMNSIRNIDGIIDATIVKL